MVWRKARASDKKPPVDADEATPEMFAAAKKLVPRIRMSREDVFGAKGCRGIPMSIAHNSDGRRAPHAGSL